MAKKLNMKVTPKGDALKVSWKDSIHPEYGPIEGVVYGLLFFGFFIIAAIMIVRSISFGSLFGILYWAAFIVLIWWLVKPSSSKKMKVIFGEDKTIAGDWTVDTAHITRFDYGLESQLLGARPALTFLGKEKPDPHLVRMWIDDVSPIVVSRNRWTLPVNHQIRDALEKTLRTVREGVAEAEHDRTYGKVTDDGIPDYD